MMLSLDAVTFDTTGLHVHSEGPDQRIWSTGAGHMIAVGIVPGPSSALAMVRGPSPLSTFRDGVASGGLAVVELAAIQREAWVLVRTILKSEVQPPNANGRAYSGMLTVPFRDGSISFRTAAYEHLVSGERESEVFAHLIATGALEWPEPPPASGDDPDRIACQSRSDTRGWVSDPSDPAPPHLARCVADDVAYDAWFPDHPLTRVRGLLDQIQHSLEVDFSAQPVASLASEPRRRWWDRWRSSHPA